MTPKLFTHWIDRLYATESEELDCQQLQAVLPPFVEAEVENKPVDAAVVRRIKTHLRQCPDCRELYDGLKYVLAHDPAQSSNEEPEEALVETAVLPTISPNL